MFGEHWTSAAHKIINKEKILFVSVSEAATTVEIDIKYYKNTQNGRFQLNFKALFKFLVVVS